MNEYGFKRHKCPVCGKVFFTYVDSAQWVYHQYGLKEYPAVCSWSCQRKSEKEREEEKKKKIRKFNGNVDEIIIELYEYLDHYYMSVRELSKEIGIKSGNFYQWRRGYCKPSEENRAIIEKYLEENWRCNR